MARILLAEDDERLAEGLVYNLERAGHEVTHCSEGPGALRVATTCAHDLMILDLMLPGLDGFGILEKLREIGLRVPVIILSAREAEVDKVRGFDAGADDYMTKPFGVAELLARIRARLGGHGDTFDLGTTHVDLRNLVVKRDGAPVDSLTPTEVELLRMLLRTPGEPVSRERLMRTIWGVGPRSSRTLDAHVTRLRKKVEADPSEPRHLVTVRGLGYRLMA